MHHSIIIASVCPRSKLSKTFHGAPRDYCLITINTNAPNAGIEKQSKLVSAAISLLRGRRSLESLGRNGICFGLHDDGLDDLLLVGVEDLREVLVQPWLFVLELW